MPKLSGITRDSAGAVLGSVIVKALRATDDALIASGVSHATTGSYSLTVPDLNNYYISAFREGPPYLAGQTRRDLTPVVDATTAPTGPSGPVVAVQNLWTGTPTTDGAYLSAKMAGTGSETTTRVAVSTSADMSNPTYTPYVMADATYRIAKHQVTGKQPGTDYWYAVEVGGTLDLSTKGRFRTLPVASSGHLKIALLACANGAALPVINAINALSPKPHMFIGLGDNHYANETSALESAHLTAWESVLSTPQRAQLHREIPSMVIYDDHCYTGDSSGGRDTTNAAKTNRQAPIDVYRRRMPMKYFSSVQEDTVDHGQVVGPVRIIVSDLRADRMTISSGNTTTRSLMGAAQKARWKAEIDAAKAAGQTVCWISTVPWNGGDWDSYRTERAELADYIKAQGMTGKVFVIAGDAHSAGISYGVDWATGGGAMVPSLQVGAANASNSSHKTFAMEHGPFPAVEGIQTNNFGIMDIVWDANNVTIHWTLIDSLNGKEWAYWSFNTKGATKLADPTTAVPSGLAKPAAFAGVKSATVTVATPTNSGNTYLKGCTVRSYPAGGVDQQAGTLAANHVITGLTEGVSYKFDYVATNHVGTSAPSTLSDAITPTGDVSAPGVLNISGGVRTEDATYVTWTLDADETIVVTNEGPAEDLFLVGGGGAGSSSSSGSTRAGAGGAGGVIHQKNVPLAPGSYAGVVGLGGIGGTTAAGTVGGDTSLIGPSVNLVAIGGARGASSTGAGTVGGSGAGGAGSSTVTVPAANTPGQGFPGGAGYASGTTSERAGGGGGGAGGPGETGATKGLGVGGDGGPGIQFAGQWFAGGGGGSGGVQGGNGQSGGGNGPQVINGASVAATSATTPGSAGGGSAFGAKAGDGAKGKIIIRRRK